MVPFSLDHAILSSYSRVTDGAHLHRTQEVGGSSPPSSISRRAELTPPPGGVSCALSSSCPVALGERP